MSAKQPAVAIAPAAQEPADGAPSFEQAVIEGGGTVVAPADAEALIWTDPRDPEALRETLQGSPARWVQLPFAGIERWIDAGVLDPNRTWTCAKGIYGPACAEQALALISMAARRVHRHARARTWTGRDERIKHRRLAGTTALIVGTGGIGRALATMLAPLDVRVIAVNRSGDPMPGAARTERVSELIGLLPEADWVVLAPALTPQTQGLIGRGELAAMKPDAWIVNVARGGVVDTDAMVEALDAGTIGGAALDVTDPEPLPDGHPFWDHPDCVITSHTANTWEMAMPDLIAMIRRNVAHFAASEPLEGLVDLTLGY